MQLELPLYDQCSGAFKGEERRAFGVEPNLSCDRVKVCCKRLPGWVEILAQSQGYHLPSADMVLPIPDLPEIIHSIRSYRTFMSVLKGEAWAVPYLRALGGNLRSADRLKVWLARQDLA